jgi:hypothetical protein
MSLNSDGDSGSTDTRISQSSAPSNSGSSLLGVTLTRSREYFCSLLKESLIIIYGTQLMLAVVEHSKGRLDTAEQ